MLVISYHLKDNIAATDSPWQQTPKQKDQLDGVVAGQEVKLVQGQLQQGENGDDHPIPQP